MTTLPMQYYGRGSARIIMPRTATRRARREWVVSPSFIILLMSLAFFTLYRITFDEPLKLKRSRTIIVLPQAPALPKTTIKEKLTFFKVVKDAARKSSESRKKELKQVIAPLKPLPASPVPPPAAKPVTKEIPKLPMPLKKQLKPLEPKPVSPLSANQVPKKRKVFPAQEKPKIPTPMTPFPTQALSSQQRPKAKALQGKKKIDLAVPSSPMPKAPGQLSQPVQQAMPLAMPSRRLTPHQMAQPEKRFSPLPTQDRIPGVKALQSGSRQQSTILANAPRKGGPAPALTQLSAPAPVTAATTAPTPGQIGHHGKPRVQATPSALPTSPLSVKEKAEAAADVDTLVQIKGTTLGQSLRVLNLKEEIYRKTRHMPASMSPYTYTIHQYQCTVVISDGPLPTAMLTFEPSDAPFEVVSALERLLPRRTM